MTNRKLESTYAAATCRSDARCWVSVTLVCLLLLAAFPAWAAPADLALPSLLDNGFSGLYNLNFVGAQKDFSTFESQHPDDPCGPVSEAAGYLFSEFSRLGVLEAQFYQSDDAFASRSKLTPDPEVKSRFESALDCAEKPANALLAKTPTIMTRSLP